MIDLTLLNCTINIAKTESGMKVLIFIDPDSKIKVTVPLNPTAAQMISSGLSGSGIIVPHTLPPDKVIRGNGQ